MNKKNTPLRIGLLLVICVFVFGIHYKEVKAEIIYSQLNSTTTANNNGYGSIHQKLGTGLTGTINSLALKGFWNGTSNNPSLLININCYDDNTYLTICTDGYGFDYASTTTNTFLNTNNEIHILNLNYELELQNTKYYKVIIEVTSSASDIVSNGSRWRLSGSNTPTDWNNGNSECFIYAGLGGGEDCGTMEDIFFFFQNNTTPNINNNTEFTEVYPTNNIITPDPNVSFEGELHITDEDIERLESIFGIFDGFIRIQAKIGDTIGFGDNGNWECQIYTEDFDISDIEILSNTIDFDFSYNFDGSNSLCPNAIYDKNYKVTWNAGGSKTTFTGGVQWTTSTTTYFTVGSTTETSHSGGLVGAVASTTEEQLSQYANGYSLEACNMLSGEWDIVNCILSMIYPDTEFIKQSFTRQYNTITGMFPLGYITDFISIIGTTTVGTLTPIDAELPSALGVGTPHITLDLTGVLDPLLNATTGVFINSSAPDTRTFYEITSDYWDIIISILFVMYLVSRVLGAGFMPTFGTMASSTTTTVESRDLGGGVREVHSSTVSKNRGNRYRI